MRHGGGTRPTTSLRRTHLKSPPRHECVRPVRPAGSGRHYGRSRRYSGARCFQTTPQGAGRRRRVRRHGDPAARPAPADSGMNRDFLGPIHSARLMRRNAEQARGSHTRDRAFSRHAPTLTADPHDRHAVAAVTSARRSPRRRPSALLTVQCADERPKVGTTDDVTRDVCAWPARNTVEPEQVLSATPLIPRSPNRLIAAWKLMMSIIRLRPTSRGHVAASRSIRLLREHVAVVPARARKSPKMVRCRLSAGSLGHHGHRHTTIGVPGMSSRDDVHRLVDQLDESVLPDAERQLRQLTQRNRDTASAADTAAAVATLRQRLPWIGSIHSGRGDLAERSSEILSNEFGARDR